MDARAALDVAGPKELVRECFHEDEVNEDAQEDERELRVAKEIG